MLLTKTIIDACIKKNLEYFSGSYSNIKFVIGWFLKVD
jgi:hypothetical protein